jgi:hypothetical protein
MALRFSLTSEGSHQKSSLEIASSHLLLLFHDYQMASSTAQAARSARKVYPNPDQVLIASVAELSSLSLGAVLSTKPTRYRSPIVN